MAGNHNNFRNNQFASLVIPLVDYFNQPAKRYNPFAALLVGNALVNFTQRWGARYTKDGEVNNQGTFADRINNDGKFVDTFATNLTTAARQYNTAGDLSIYSQLKERLKSVGIDQPNAWTDFNTAVDYYFANVNIIDYFNYSINKGADRNFYNESIAAFRHPHINQDAGFYVEDFVEGKDVGFNVTTITTAASGGSEFVTESPYFIIWSSDTERYIVWLTAAAIFAPPLVPPILGISDIYVQVDVTPFNTPTQNQTSLINAINGILGTPFTAVAGNVINPGAPEEQREVIITANTAGAHPDSTFNIISFNTLLWDGSFTAADPGAAYEFGFVYSNLTLANSSTLFGKTFIIYALNGDAYVFYYTDGVVTPDAIQCGGGAVDVPCYQDVAISVTAIDLVGAGVTTLAGLYDETYKTIAATVPGVTYNADRGEIGTITYDVEGAVTQPNAGTALPGVNYSFSSKIWGSDLTLLASDVDSAEKYIEYWNTLKVPYEATLGKEYPYLGGAVYSTGSIPQRCGDACGTGKQGIQLPNDERYTCFLCNGTNPGVGTFRTVPGPYNYPLTEYNTPALIFNIPENTKGMLGLQDID